MTRRFQSTKAPIHLLLCFLWISAVAHAQIGHNLLKRLGHFRGEAHAVSEATNWTTTTSSKRQAGQRSSSQLKISQHYERAMSASSRNKKERSLQAAADDINPCTVPIAEAVLTDLEGKQFLTTSFVESCVSNLMIDPDLMRMHLEELRLTFQQYHCFFNLVNDPPNSDPSLHQAELGYSIVNNDDYGAPIPLNQILLDLIDSLDTVSNATMFWAIEHTFGRLFDGHIGLPTMNAQNVAGNYWIQVMPARSLQGATTPQVGFPEVQYNSAGDFVLEIAWQDTTGNDLSTDVVTQINGVTPLELFAAIANSGAVLGLGYMSPGARLNQVLRFVQSALSKRGAAVFSIPGIARPSLLLPESFQVTYASGETETFFTSMELIGGGYTTESFYNTLTNMSAGEATVTEPGVVFMEFARAIIEALGNMTGSTRRSVPNSSANNYKRMRNLQEVAGNSGLPTRRKVGQPVGTWKHSDNAATTSQSVRRKAGSRRLQDYTFDVAFTDPDSGEFVGAVKVEGNYVVLKLVTFMMPRELMLDVWQVLTKAAAAAANIKKLILDISDNGGGVVVAGETLVTSMFPFTPYFWFQSNWDSNLNQPMMVYNETVQPIVDFFDSFDVTEVTAWAASLTPEQLESLLRISLALINLCEGTCQTSGPSCNTQPCERLKQATTAIEDFQQFPQPPQLINLIQTIVGIMNELNPWTVTGNDEIDRNRFRQVVRGGVSQTLTHDFTFYTEEMYMQAVAMSLQTNHFFEEYVVVSNGAAASTSAIIATRIQQIYSNRALLPQAARDKMPKVVTVSYGGTNNLADMTMASIPASVVETHIEFPLISEGLLLMLGMLFPENETGAIAEIDAALEAYDAVLPIPPFFANSLPRMPVVNFYSKFMNDPTNHSIPRALPLQYIRIPPNEHIPHLFIDVTLTETADLPALYSNASEFFTPGGGGGGQQCGAGQQCCSNTDKCQDSADCCTGLKCYSRQKPNNKKCAPCAKKNANCVVNEECCDFPSKAKCDQTTLRCVKCQPAGRKCKNNNRCCSNACNTATRRCL